MRIATNMPQLFISEDNYDFVEFDINMPYHVDCIVLILGKIFRSYAIPDLERILCIIKKYRSIPCYLVGCSTVIPNTDFFSFRDDNRDALIKDLINEILLKSSSVGVSDNITYLFLTDFFGFPQDRIDLLENNEDIISFLNKNMLHWAMPYADKIMQLLPVFDTPYTPRFSLVGIKYKNIHAYDIGKDIDIYNTIIISSPFIFEQSNDVSYAADVFVEGINKKIYLQTNSAFSKYLLVERLDAFVFGLLPWAMRNGKNILCLSPITAEFLHNLEHILIPLLVAYDSRYHHVSITAPIDDSDLPCGNAVSTAISCGVDSFYTVQKYTNICPPP